MKNAKEILDNLQKAYPDYPRTQLSALSVLLEGRELPDHLDGFIVDRVTTSGLKQTQSVAGNLREGLNAYIISPEIVYITS